MTRSAQREQVVSQSFEMVPGIGRFSFLRRGCWHLLAVAMVVLWPFVPLTSVAASQSVGHLVVDENSHVVVMEYEAWFGPNAVTFQGSAAMPLLQSADMKKVGGGYD